MRQRVQMQFVHDEPVSASKLNGTYYQEEGPAEYILGRLYALIAIGAKTDGFLDLIGQDTEFHGLHVSLQQADGEKDEATTGEQNGRFVDHFTRIELHALKHLAIETLLRLFLAHRSTPPCPWLEISRITNSTNFKEAVEQSILNEDESVLIRDCARVFLGTDLVPAESPDEEGEAASNLAGFVRDFASAWLDQAYSYNSTKHGLTAIPGAAVLDIGLPEDGLTRVGEGDSLAHLTHEYGEDNERHWFLTTRWIRPREAVATIALIHHLLDALWSIARRRYGFADSFNRFALPPDVYSPESLTSADLNEMQELSLPLFTEATTAP